MPRFVILEHTWDGVHWDLMLESEGSLATWAIDAPIVHNAQLPARALAPHRLDYLDYEGPISGERGSVKRVDEGTYAIRLWTPDRVVIDLRGRHTTGVAELTKAETRGIGSPLGAWSFRLGKVD